MKKLLIVLLFIPGLSCVSADKNVSRDPQQVTGNMGTLSNPFKPTAFGVIMVEISRYQAEKSFEDVSKESICHAAGAAQAALLMSRSQELNFSNKDLSSQLKISSEEMKKLEEEINKDSKKCQGI